MELELELELELYFYFYLNTVNLSDKIIIKIAFNVGSGKVVPWEKFEGVMKQPEKLEILDPPSQNASGAPRFKIVRHRHMKKSSVKADFSAENENQDQISTGQNKPDDLRFPCPENG